MRQRDVFALQAFDVAHHFCFGVVFVEYLVCQEWSATAQVAVQRRCFGNVGHFLHGFFGGNREDGEQEIDIFQIGCLIDAEAYVTIVVVTQVYFLTQCNCAELLCRYVVGKAETQGVEEYFVVLHIAQTSQGFVQPSGDAVDTFGNVLDSFLAVIHSIEACHCSEQCLCGTDVGSCFFTFDMLFSGL